MRRLLWVSGSLVLCGITSIAGAQFSPPGLDVSPPPTANDSGGAAISMSPPTVDADSTPPAPHGRPAIPAQGQRRPSQSYTTQGLIGHINAEPVYVMDIIRPLD